MMQLLYYAAFILSAILRHAVAHGLEVPLGERRSFVRKELTLASTKHALAPTPKGHEAKQTQNSFPYLYVLNSYPALHSLLTAQAKALLSWNANLDVLLTSHVNVSLSDDPPLSTVKVPPYKYCHNQGHETECYRAEEGGKLIGATFLANHTRHGFKWLLIGDDDTTFFPINLERALKQYDHRKPYYLGFHIDPSDDITKLFTSAAKTYRDAFDRCPPLGNPKERRYVAFDPDRDITEQRRDCNASIFQHRDWFRFSNGGRGTALSAGLLDSIPPEKWQKCIDRIYYSNSDVRLGMCLALLGYKVQELDRDRSIPVSDHRLEEGSLYRIVDMNQQKKMCVNATCVPQMPHVFK